MFGIHKNKNVHVDNDSRPIKMVEVAPGIYHIVYAD